MRSEMERMYRKERIYPRESTVFSNKGEGDDSPLKEMADALGELKKKGTSTLQCYQLMKQDFSTRQKTTRSNSMVQL